MHENQRASIIAAVLGSETPERFSVITSIKPHKSHFAESKVSIDRDFVLVFDAKSQKDGATSRGILLRALSRRVKTKQQKLEHLKD